MAPNATRRIWETQQVIRRELMGATAALTAFAIVPRHVLAGSGQPVPGEKMNVGCVGVV